MPDRDSYLWPCVGNISSTNSTLTYPIFLTFPTGFGTIPPTRTFQPIGEIMDNLRRNLGFLFLVISLASFITLIFIRPSGMVPEPGILFFSFIFYAWLITAHASYIGMIVNQRKINLGLLATVLVMILILIATVSTPTANSEPLTRELSLMYSILLLGGIMFNLAESVLFYLKDDPR